MPAKVLLVIPCYKEQDRLPHFLPHLLAELTASDLDVVVQPVDDGSGPEQQTWLGDYCASLAPRYPILRAPLLCPVNQGKGGAVYAGWDASQGETWLGFVDADGAISPSEVVRVLTLAANSPADHAIFAVRTGQNGTEVKRTWQRRLSGQVFRWLVKFTFRFPLADTQCGFKLVGAEFFKKIRPSLREMRYCFDVEMAHYILKAGMKITPVPISWSESPGSRLGARSVLSMAQSVLSLRKRLGRWAALEPK